MTAVIRAADARLSASMRISSSIRLSFAGNEFDWITKTSCPRTFSWISTKISMSAKRFTWPLVRGSFRCAPIASARGRLELPATSFIVGVVRPSGRGSKGMYASTAVRRALLARGPTPVNGGALELRRIFDAAS
jgi:hypothetical protein